MPLSHTISERLRQLDEGTLDVMALLAATDEFATAGQPNAAITLFHAWISKYPDHPLLFAVLFNFGAACSANGNLAQAQAAFRLAIERNPDFMPPYINLGNVLEQIGEKTAAVQQWNAAVERLSKVTRETIDFKLMALKQMGRVLAAGDFDDLAEQALQQSLALDLGQRDILQHWFNLRQRQCRWPLLAPLSAEAQRRVLEEISPLSLASFQDDPLWQLANAAASTKADVGRPAFCLPDRVLPDDPVRRLRVGYLSADLCEHAIGYLTAEIYGLHDRSKVEIFAYYNGRDSGDRILQRIKGSVDHWCDIRDSADGVVAQTIANDGIDILVDLSGHTKDARTALLGCNPAPVIVNWLGYPGSMGSPFHHYLIADSFIVPVEAELYYSEKVLRLPCYQPTDRQRLVAEARPSRAAAGLPEQAMVFCCFNEPRKITEATWLRWMQILRMVEGSVLWLLIPAASSQDHLRALATQQEVAPDRLVFAKRQNNPDHLARYPLADLILDSFPYGAHTTASDALWMGVPVLTMVGSSFASRVCGSLLQAAGLPELICDSVQDYLDRAIEIGRDPARRAALRQRLEAEREGCLLFDTPLLVRALEDLYRQMWDDYCRGERPQPDLSNLALYQEIGVDLAGAPPPADYHGEYRRRLAGRQSYNFVSPDPRVWPGRR